MHLGIFLHFSQEVVGVTLNGKYLQSRAICSTKAVFIDLISPGCFTDQ